MRLRVIPLLGGLVLAGCEGPGPARPESPLVGTWRYYFTAYQDYLCADGKVRRIGVDAGGTLEFATAADGTLSVSGSGGFGVDSCGSTGDGGGPINATRLGVPVQVFINPCDATIPEPTAGADHVEGTVLCLSVRTPGTITLERH